jgi:nitrogen fixation NifU-like protein
MAEESWKDVYENPQEPNSPFMGPILIYNELVIEHFTNPRNVGKLENPDGEAVVGDPSCGDQMKVSIQVDDNKIIDIKFRSYGCPGAIATSSMMTELAKGKTIEEALMITDDDVIISLGGIPARKKHCSLMGIKGLQEAVRNYVKKQKALAK